VGSPVPATFRESSLRSPALLYAQSCPRKVARLALPFGRARGTFDHLPALVLA
jgi:hypothetical protein